MLAVTDLNRYAALLDRMTEAFHEARAPGDFSLGSMAMELLSYLQHDARQFQRQTQPGPPYNRAVLAALELIDRESSSKLTLKALAKAVNLSPIHFHHLFTAAVGHTPHQVLIQKRLERAQNLLRTSDRPLTEIAGQCGFASQSYFNYVFKRERNQTPTEYRRLHSQQYRL